MMGLVFQNLDSISMMGIKFELNLNDGAHGKVRQVAILGVPDVLARQPKVYLKTMRIIMAKKMTMIMSSLGSQRFTCRP